MTSSPTQGQKDSEVMENLRTEYSAVISAHNAYVGFRLTLLGFFLAAVALLAINPGRVPGLTYFVGAIVTLALLSFELRTKQIYTHIGHRGITIEQKRWGYDKTNESPLFSRMFPNEQVAPGQAREDYPLKQIFNLK